MARKWKPVAILQRYFYKNFIYYIFVFRMESKKKEKSSKKEKKKERNLSIGKSSSMRDKGSLKKAGSISDTSAVGGVTVNSPTITKFPSLSRVGKTAELHLAFQGTENSPKIVVNICGNFYNKFSKFDLKIFKLSFINRNFPFEGKLTLKYHRIFLQTLNIKRIFKI